MGGSPLKYLTGWQLTQLVKLGENAKHSISGITANVQSFHKHKHTATFTTCGTSAVAFLVLFRLLWASFRAFLAFFTAFSVASKACLVLLAKSLTPSALLLHNVSRN